MSLAQVLRTDAATVYQLDRSIEAARAPELLSLYRVVRAATTGDRGVLYELVRATEGGFAANLLRGLDDAHSAAEES